MKEINNTTSCRKIIKMPVPPSLFPQGKLNATQLNSAYITRVSVMPRGATVAAETKRAADWSTMTCVCTCTGRITTIMTLISLVIRANAK